MKFRPCFKNVVIERLVTAGAGKPVPSRFVMPEELQQHSTWKIVDYANDCTLQNMVPGPLVGHIVVVEHHLVKEITFDGQVFNVVPEHAVLLVSIGE